MTQPTVYTGGRLAPSVQATQPQDNAVRTGTVLSVSGSAAVIDVAGGKPIVGVLASYAPVVGDTVALIRNGATWLVFGRINDADVAGPPYSGRQLIGFREARCTAATSPAVTTVVDVNGASFVWTQPYSTATWFAWAYYDFLHGSATQSTAVGYLNVDGVQQFGQAIFNAAALNERATVGQMWTGTDLAKGDHTFKLQMQVLTASTFTAQTDHTHLFVQFYR